MSKPKGAYTRVGPLRKDGTRRLLIRSWAGNRWCRIYFSRAVMEQDQEAEQWRKSLGLTEPVRF